MAVLISGIIRRAQRILQDVLGTRWDEPELIDWFNDGRRELAVVRPSEFATRLAVSLAEGTLQQLPANVFQLLRVDCNLLSVSPRLAGRAVTMVERRVMNMMHPRWQEAEAFPFAAQAKHYVYESTEPTTFHVFPGNDGTGTVEVSAAVLPADAVASTEPIGVRDIYANALLDYVLYRAFAKDADHPGNAERSAGHYAAFSSALGMKAQVEATITPAEDGA
jgi:hypothetical protein